MLYLGGLIEETACAAPPATKPHGFYDRMELGIDQVFFWLSQKHPE
jgi:hypothetical protein